MEDELYEVESQVKPAKLQTIYRPDRMKTFILFGGVEVKKNVFTP